MLATSFCKVGTSFSGSMASSSIYSLSYSSTASSASANKFLSLSKSSLPVIFFFALTPIFFRSSFAISALSFYHLAYQPFNHSKNNFSVTGVNFDDSNFSLYSSISSNTSFCTSYSANSGSLFLN